jgi:hypothetical protein
MTTDPKAIADAAAREGHRLYSEAQLKLSECEDHLAAIIQRHIEPLVREIERLRFIEEQFKGFQYPGPDVRLIKEKLEAERRNADALRRCLDPNATVSYNDQHAALAAHDALRKEGKE